MAGNYINESTLMLLFSKMTEEQQIKFIRSPQFRCETNVLHNTLKNFCQDKPRVLQTLNNLELKTIMKGDVPCDEVIEWMKNGPGSYKVSLQKVKQLYWDKMNEKQKSTVEQIEADRATGFVFN